MRSEVRRTLEMAARVREFILAHSSTESSYAPVLARLEERLRRAGTIAARQHEGLAAARAARAMTSVKALIATAKEQKALLVEQGMKAELLDDVDRQVAELEAVLESARTSRRDRIGARAELEVIIGEIQKQVKVLDGITRYRFGMSPQMMAEWKAVRRLPGRPQGAVAPDPGGIAPAA